MNNSNMFLAMVLSFAVWAGFHYLYEVPRLEQQRVAMVQQKADAQGKPVSAVEGGTEIKTPRPSAPALRERAAVIAETPRLPIRASHLQGSINLAGARFDDITLTKYQETTADNSPAVTLLSPSGAAKPYPSYYAAFGWLGDNIRLPDAASRWTTDAQELVPNKPVTLRWENGEGLVFERTVIMDDSYLFTVTDGVKNNTQRPVTLHPYALVSRHTKPEMNDAIGHVGPQGVLEGVLREHGYDDLIDDGNVSEQSTGGWLGITSKYWMSVLVPPQDEVITASFKYAADASGKPEEGRFQTDFRGAPRTIQPNQSVSFTSHLIAGAKELPVLDRYEDELKVPNLDMVIDFGWFKFLTKPLMYMLLWLGYFLGNVGLAILALTVLVKLCVLPLGVKANISMAKMKRLQPELKRLSERYKEDRQKLSVEMMQLYQRERVSPLSGCIPILAQLPVFFALYKVLYIGINMRHAPFYGWIRDLSAPDPTTIFNLFGLINWQPPAIGLLHIGVWPLAMGVSMYALQKMNPAPPDPMQAQIMMAMPIVFTLMLGPSMPAGLLIYWTCSNVISIAQQTIVFRRIQAKHAT